MYEACWDHGDPYLRGQVKQKLRQRGRRRERERDRSTDQARDLENYKNKGRLTNLNSEKVITMWGPGAGTYGERQRWQKGNPLPSSPP